MVTVEADAAGVERRLGAGLLACGFCGGVLARWGWARERELRGVAGERRRVRPRRGRCSGSSGCGRTHVLLPVNALVRRADDVAVIGAALEGKAAGRGHRVIAVGLDRPPSTVRGWLRRFRARAGPLREAFTALLCALGADALLPAAAGSQVADAVAAIVAAAGAVARRWAVLAVSPWLVAGAVTSGRLLAQASTVELTNTSCPW